MPSFLRVWKLAVSRQWIFKGFGNSKIIQVMMHDACAIPKHTIQGYGKTNQLACFILGDPSLQIQELLLCSVSWSDGHFVLDNGDRLHRGCKR